MEFPQTRQRVLESSVLEISGTMLGQKGFDPTKVFTLEKSLCFSNNIWMLRGLFPVKVKSPNYNSVYKGQASERDHRLSKVKQIWKNEEVCGITVPCELGIQ